MSAVLDAVNQANASASSAAAALTSENNSKTSENNAKTSETDAAQSAADAANSAASVNADNIIHIIGSGLGNEGYTKIEADAALSLKVDNIFLSKKILENFLGFNF